MAAIQIDADSAQAKQAVDDVNATLAKMSAQFTTVTSSMVLFNKAGEVAKAQVRGLDSAGRELEANFKKLKNGFEQTSTGIKESFKALQNPTNTLNSILASLNKELRDVVVTKEKLGAGDIIRSAQIEGVNNLNQRVTVTVKNLQGLLTITDKVTGKTLPDTKRDPLPKDFVSPDSKKVKDFVNELSSTYSKLYIATEQTNRAGQTYSATLKGVAADGRTATISLQSVNGQLTNMGSRVTDVQKLREETLKLTGGLTNIREVAERVQRSFQYFVTYRAFNLITNQVQNSLEAIRKYQIQISLIRTLSQENQLSFGQWSQEIKKVSDQLGTPLQDTAEAVFLTISNQVAKGREALNFVKEAGQLSRTTGASTAQAANLLSSAINAYGKSASDAGQLSALFFKTIDEGRVVAGDLSDSFGTVAVLARELGVSVEDLNATLAFITQSGVRTDTAMTFLRNTFLQLQKPSESLIAYFEKIGAANSKVAITASGGFGNFIQTLVKDIKEGNLEIAKLFPELRAQQGIAAAFGRPEELDAITKRFNDLSATAQNFKNAIEIREESDANTISKELNKLQNALTVDFGSKVAALIADFLKLAGGGNSLAEGLNRVLVVTRDLGIAYVAFRIATTTATAAILGIASAQRVAATSTLLTTQATIGQTAATNAATLATERFNLALKANIIGLAVAAGVYFGSRDAFTQDLITEQVDKLDAITEANKRYRKEFETPVVVQRAAIDNFLDTIKAKALDATKVLTAFQQKNNQALSDIRQRNQRGAAEIGEQFKLYVESLKDGLENIRKTISGTRSLIGELTRSIIEMRRLADDTVRGVIQKFSTDGQKLRFFDQEIARTQREAKALFEKGDAESVGKANKLLEDNIRLREQQLDLIVQGKKDLVEGKPVDEDFRNELLKRREADFKGRFNSLGQPLVEVDVAGFKARLDKVVAFQEAASKRLIEIKEKEVARLQDIENKEKVRIETLQKAFKEFNEFSAFDKDGGIKGEFKDKLTGRLKPEAIKAAFDEIAKKLQDVAGNDFGQRFQLESLLGQRKKDIIAEVAAADRVEQTKLAQLKLQQLQEFYKQQTELNRKAIKEASAASDASVEKQRDRFAALDALQKELEKRNKAITDAAKVPGVDPDSAVGRQLGLPEKVQTAKQSQVLLDRFGEALQRYKDALQDLQKNRENVQGQLVPRASDIEKATAAYAKLREVVNDIDRNLPNNQKLGLTRIPGGQPGDDFNSVFRQLKEQVDELKRQFFAGQNANTRQGALEAEFKNTADKLAALSGAYPAATKALADSIAGSTAQLEKYVQSLIDLSNKVQGIKPGAAAGGEAPPGFSEGGFVGGRPGVDTNLARLTRGEYVVNARSAYQFADVLTAINRSRGNVNTVRGGDIMNTRVGDIVINYQSSGNSKVDARSLAGEIRREMRLGNVRS